MCVLRPQKGFLDAVKLGGTAIQGEHDPPLSSKLCYEAAKLEQTLLMNEGKSGSMSARTFRLTRCTAPMAGL